MSKSLDKIRESKAQLDEAIDELKLKESGESKARSALVNAQAEHGVDRMLSSLKDRRSNLVRQVVTGGSAAFSNAMGDWVELKDDTGFFTGTSKSSIGKGSRSDLKAPTVYVLRIRPGFDLVYNPRRILDESAKEAAK